MQAIKRGSMRRLLWIIGYCFVGALGGVSGFLQQPMAVQLDLAHFLAGIATVLFGILGVWIAVLNPKDLLSKPISEPESPDYELLLKLLGPWLQSTAVLLLAVLMSWAMASSLPAADEETPSWLLNIAAGVNLFITLFILDSIIGTLLPVSRLRKQLLDWRQRRESRQ